MLLSNKFFRICVILITTNCVMGLDIPHLTALDPRSELLPHLKSEANNAARETNGHLPVHILSSPKQFIPKLADSALGEQANTKQKTISVSVKGDGLPKISDAVTSSRFLDNFGQDTPTSKFNNEERAELPIPGSPILDTLRRVVEVLAKIIPLIKGTSSAEDVSVGQEELVRVAADHGSAGRVGGISKQQNSDAPPLNFLKRAISNVRSPA